MKGAGYVIHDGRSIVATGATELDAWRELFSICKCIPATAALLDDLRSGRTGWGMVDGIACSVEEAMPACSDPCTDEGAGLSLGDMRKT